MRALFFLFALCPLLSMAAKPNVLLICVDDLKPTIGCFGDSQVCIRMRHFQHTNGCEKKRRLYFFPKKSMDVSRFSTFRNIRGTICHR